MATGVHWANGPIATTLRNAADRHLSATLSASLTAALHERLTELETMAERAREMRDQDGGGQRGSVERVTASYILTGES